MSTLRDACRRIRAGDREAFAEIVRATSSRLVRVAARMMGSVAEGEDVVQEAYCRAFDAIVEGRYDGRAEVETWLYRIVSNGALDALRSPSRRLRSEVETPELAASPEASLEARAGLRVLHMWIAQLPPEQRAALVLKEMEGLATAAVGEVMGLSEGAVEQLLVRARAMLRARRDHERD